MFCCVFGNTKLGLSDPDTHRISGAFGGGRRMDSLRRGETGKNIDTPVKKKYLTIAEASCILRKDVKIYSLTEEVCDGIVGTDTAL